MTSRPLTLIRTDRPTPPVSAGWLASPDPMEWLREAAHCRNQGCELALYPVASSAADPRAAGVLLIPHGAAPRFRPRVQPLAELLPGLHGPTDAALSASLLPNERGYFFPYPIQFFHPSYGLIGFELHDALSPARLLHPPPSRAPRWNLALPVEPFAPALKAILIAAPPDPGVMLEEAAQHIGDQAGKTPATGDGLLEQAGALGKGLAGGLLLGAGLVAGAIGRVLGHAPTGASGPDANSIDRLTAWAQRHWQQLTDRRTREITRLMKLMETDPDAGLRFALPLAGIEQSRGKAAPTWQLRQRDTRYTLGHGGGAIDGWDLANEHRLTLERQYREAARREIALGRLERAAYVFGNLLGDWNSAAKTLSDGGRHRDAAAIYLHKLNNRPAAAKCLEDGGLLLQAAAIYVEAGHHEKAGDLHAQLGNHATARELWQTAADTQRDPLEKARVLTEKLRDHQAALQLLDETWQSGIRPEAALAAMFDIHHRESPPATAVTLLRRMFAHPPGSFPLPARLKLGHREAARWSDPALAAELENQAYHHIGRALAAGAGDTRALLDFLPQLDPADLLLARDAKRYSVFNTPLRIPASATPAGHLRPTKIIPLPKDVRWQSLATLPDGLTIVGEGAAALAVARFQSGSCHLLALPLTEHPGGSIGRHFAVHSGRNCSLIFHLPARGRVLHHPIDRPQTRENQALSHRRNILAAGPFKDPGDFAVLEYTRTSTLSVHIYSATAGLRRTITVDLASPEVSAMTWHMAGRDGHLCFAAEGFLAWRYADGRILTMGLGEGPRALWLSPAVIQPEALVALSREVILVEIPPADKPGKRLETINLHSVAESGSPPVCCYLPDGSIVIAQRGGGLVYPPDDRTTASATLSLPPDAGTPIAACASGAGGFALLTDRDNLVIYHG